MTRSSHNRQGTSRVNPGRSFTSDQADLFPQDLDLVRPAATSDDLDINLELLAACNTAIRDARSRGLSREHIVDRMNELLPGLPKAITLRQLNSWTAASQAEFKPFPARFLPAFCAATECDEPLRVLTEPIGREVIDSRELDTMRLGRSLVESARLKREQHFLRRRLGG